MRHANHPIRAYLTPSVHAVDLETPLPQARKLMLQHGIRHLPVLDGQRLVGVVSQRDILALEASPFIDMSTVSVHDAMAEVPYTVSPETPLAEVVQVMAENKYGSVVVMEGERVCGIFTSVDAMSVLAELLLRQA